MNSRILKILISTMLAACLAATPVFGIQDDYGSADGEIFESEPGETYQDVESEADSWRYEDGQIVDENAFPGETEVVLPEGAAVMGSSSYGETADKYWTVDGSKFSGGYLKGIDVSVWQGQGSDLRSKIDWTKVKKDVKEKGVYDFVIIRCGYGINTTSRDDSEFEYNVQQCEKYDIPYGVYLYSYAENSSQASSEAAHALRMLKGHYPDYPVYYDLEDSSILKATGSSKSKITGFAKTFCSKLDNNGYRSGVYANLNWFSNYIDKSQLKNYNLWVAQWPGKSQKYSNGSAYSIWQCSSSGSVSGIYGRVDIDLLVKPASYMEDFMTYDSLPSTLTVKNADYDAYLNAGGVALREGPGPGYRPTDISSVKRVQVHVSRTANGYAEITDGSGNRGWIADSRLSAPEDPWGVEDNVLVSYAGDVLKDAIVSMNGYVYGTDGNGEIITGRSAWIGCMNYTFDSQGRAYINRSKTKKKVTVYAKAGSDKKGTLAKGKTFYVLKTSGKWSQMANGQWVATANIKKTAVYPTIRPSTETRYTTTMKTKAASYSGPSTSYIKKSTLKKGKKVTVVGTYGSWAKLTTGYWVPKSKLR